MDETNTSAPTENQPIVEGTDTKMEAKKSDDFVALLEMLERLKASISPSDDDSEDDDPEDDDFGDDELEDNDFDLEDDDTEDDDSEDDEFEDDAVYPEGAGDIPVGKRVFRRGDFKSNTAYCNAVLKSMQAVLRKNRISVSPQRLREGVYIFRFDKLMWGIDVDVHILVEYGICNYLIEFIMNTASCPGRAALTDYFCVDKTFSLRYGAFTIDHRDNEKKLEYSSCFYGAFSEEAFERYWKALESTLYIYAKDYVAVTGGKKLDSDQRRLVRTLLNDLARNLPSKIHPDHVEKAALLKQSSEALGGKISPTMQRLLVYVVEHIG